MLKMGQASAGILFYLAAGEREEGISKMAPGPPTAQAAFALSPSQPPPPQRYFGAALALGGGPVPPPPPLPQPPGLSPSQSHDCAWTLTFLCNQLERVHPGDLLWVHGGGGGSNSSTCRGRAGRG